MSDVADCRALELLCRERAKAFNVGLVRKAIRGRLATSPARRVGLTGGLVGPGW
jgi:hypothetical protein